VRLGGSTCTSQHRFGDSELPRTQIYDSEWRNSSRDIHKRHHRRHTIFSLLPTPTANMPPVANLPITTEASSTPHTNGKPLAELQPSPAQTAILHRTPWIPPVAVRGEGVYLELEDGSRLIDGVGGAAVNCIGSGHPRVVAAIKDQLEKLACEYPV
jgi:hypothetical protein